MAAKCRPGAIATLRTPASQQQHREQQREQQQRQRQQQQDGASPSSSPRSPTSSTSAILTSEEQELASWKLGRTVRSSTGQIYAVFSPQEYDKITARDRMASLRALLSCISGMPVVKDLTPFQQVLLVTKMTLQQVGAGGAVYEQGDAADAMYIVKSGEVKVMPPTTTTATAPEATQDAHTAAAAAGGGQDSHTSTGGRASAVGDGGQSSVRRVERQGVTVPAGQAIGEAALFTSGGCRTASVLATTYTVLWQLTREQYSSVLGMGIGGKTHTTRSVATKWMLKRSKAKATKAMTAKGAAEGEEGDDTEKESAEKNTTTTLSGAHEGITVKAAA